MNTQNTPPPRLTAQGIATYLLLESEKPMFQIFPEALPIINNLLLAHEKALIDLDHFEDILDLTEGKSWEFEQGWQDVTEEKEQNEIRKAMTVDLPRLKNDEKIISLVESIAMLLLQSDQPVEKNKHRSIINAIVDNLLKAHCIENLDLEELNAKLKRISFVKPALVS
jgi:hypothetical protein